MAEPDLEAELEAAGADVVRRNLARGAYNYRKVPIVKEWLRQKDAATAETTSSQDRKDARFDRIFTRTIAVIGLLISLLALYGSWFR